MEEAFRAILLGSTAITDRVAQRVVWGWRAQGSPMPAITLNVVNDMGEPTLDGPGPSEARIQVDCYAATHKDVKLLAQAVRVLLDCRHDSTFQGIFLAGLRDLPETDSVTTVHRVSMDFTTTYIFNG